MFNTKAKKVTKHKRRVNLWHNDILEFKKPRLLERTRNVAANIPRNR